MATQKGVAPDEVDPMGKCPSCGRREDACEWVEMIMPFLDKSKKAMKIRS